MIDAPTQVRIHPDWLTQANTPEQSGKVKTFNQINDVGCDAFAELGAICL